MTTLGTNRAEAFTLIEALMASVLLTLVASAALLPFTAGVQNDQVVGRRAEGVALAQGMMELILSKPFYDPDEPDTLMPGPEGGEGNRSLFDNADDFDGYAESGGDVFPVGLWGPDARTAADRIDPGLSRTVTVDYVRLDGQSASQPYNVCRVTVVVYDGSLEVARLSRLIYGDALGDTHG